MAEPAADTSVSPSTTAWVVGAIVLAWGLLAALSLATQIRTPFSDAHDWVWRVFQLERDGYWLGYLWAPHNAQRIPLARLAMWWDVEGPQTGVSSFLGSTMLVQLAAALAVALLALPALPAGRWRIPAAVAVGLAALNVAFVEAASFPFAGVYIYAASLAVLAVALQARRGGLSLTAALGCAVLASLGNAAGLAVWPAMVVTALLGPRPVREGLLLAGAGAVVGLVVSGGLPAPTAAGSGVTTDIAKLASYFSGFLTLPLGSRPDIPVRLLGAVVAVAYGVIVVGSLARRGRGDVPPRTLSAAGGLIVFALLTAALAALGRAGELPEPFVPVRYAPFAIAGQVGLLLALAPLFVRWAQDRQRLATAGVVVALFVWAGLQADGARRLYKSAGHIREASVAFDRGDRSPATLALVHPRPEFAAQVRAELRRRGLPN